MARQASTIILFALLNRESPIPTETNTFQPLTYFSIAKYNVRQLLPGFVDDSLTPCCCALVHCQQIATKTFELRDCGPLGTEIRARMTHG